MHSMSGREKRKFDTTKNRKLMEFLEELEIEVVKKEKIMSYIEKLTFQKVKEASIGKKDTTSKVKLRLNYSK